MKPIWQKRHKIFINIPVHYGDCSGGCAGKCYCYPAGVHPINLIVHHQSPVCQIFTLQHGAGTHGGPRVTIGISRLPDIHTAARSGDTGVADLCLETTACIGRLPSGLDMAVDSLAIFSCFRFYPLSVFPIEFHIHTKQMSTVKAWGPRKDFLI